MTAMLAVLSLSVVAMASDFKFEVSISESLIDEPIDGRAFVIISNNYSSEPKSQVDVTGVPFWGLTVDQVNPGETIVFSNEDSAVYGYPLEKIGEIPAGDYYVQAFFAVYETYNRSDGKVIKAELPGEGGPQRKFTNPGNFYSTAQKIYIDPASDSTIKLVMDKEVQPTNPLKDGEVVQQGNYPDTKFVKYVKIKSELLSEFWGQDMYIGANVLLPNSYYDDTTTLYPVWYQQGHWPGGRAPLSYGNGGAIDKTWNDPASPQMIVVEFRDANPYFGTSYSFDSANFGHYGSAITEELIPYLESQFRMIPEGWARLLSGGSTGGWESMAMQVFYPTYFGGTWPLCPDSLDFKYHQIVNIYEDANAYYKEYDWLKVERPSNRKTDGNINYTMKQENLYERALGGENAVGGQQWAIWEAVYSPVDVSGYPARIWDPLTGVIDKKVASYWKDHYDLRVYLEKNWSSIGEDLVGKIHLRIGDMDGYYLNLGVYEMEKFLESTTDPYYDGYVKTFPKLGHTGNITTSELLFEMADHLIKYGPDGIEKVLYPNGK